MSREKRKANTLPIRVYADTSVYGGVHDEEFAKWSKLFFRQAKEGRFEICTSPVLEEELLDAPEPVRTLYEKVAIEAVSADTSEEAVLLQEAYLSVGIVAPRSADDALHVAFATVMNCSLLVSWNFKHIVHFDKIALYNAINVVEGYTEIGIHTPSEVIAYEEDL